jgi:hypothetical protein
MKSYFCIVAFVVFGLTGISRAEEGATTYYVQLIRGTADDKPPIRTCRRVGPRLVATLRPVWKWKSYWEICSKSVSLEPGRATRVRLANGREVEIDLSIPTKRKVTAYQNGVAVDRTTLAVGDRMTITGGDRDEQSVWFIVIYRDKPTASKHPI